MAFPQESILVFIMCFIGTIIAKNVLNRGGRGDGDSLVK